MHRRGREADDAARGVLGLGRLGGQAAARRAADGRRYERVDVAFVAEATYPFVRGGVASIIHEMITEMKELSVGIIHIAWDRSSPSQVVYPRPQNLRWIYTIYLAAHEHRLRLAGWRWPKMTSPGRRRAVAEALFAALAAARRGEFTALARVYAAYLDLGSRSCDFWRVYRSREFMEVLQREFAPLGLSAGDCFWLQREFFALAYAVLNRRYPPAAIYHSHIQLSGGLAAAVAARQNGGRSVLTEHGLYVRDSLNYLFKQCASHPITVAEARAASATDPTTRAWVEWIATLGRLVYEQVDATTYQYQRNFDDAAAFGAVRGKTVFISNGIDYGRFAPARERQQVRHALRQAYFARGAAPGPAAFTWRLAFMGRIVYVKGVCELINAFAALKQRVGWPMHLDVIGPSDEEPHCLADCRALVERLGLSADVSFPGAQDLAVALGEVDLVILPSYSEILPIVILEALAASVPVVATDTGSVSQILAEPTGTGDGEVGAAGLVVPARDAVALAAAVEAVLGSADRYAMFHRNAPLRILRNHRAKGVMDAYRELYRALGDQSHAVRAPTPRLDLAADGKELALALAAFGSVGGG